jgi:hypothetical protein
MMAVAGALLPEIASAAPNGTWLSRPQIAFHASTQTLDQVMADIRAQQYRIVFLDFRNVPEVLQQEVSQKARQQRLIPVVWVQSPEYRSLTVEQLLDEVRYGDGIQVDDHFFANYSVQNFYALRRRYTKPIYCSIQPSQVKHAPFWV